MPGLSERQPLGSISTSAPRQAPRPLVPGPAPDPSGWVRHLEDGTDTVGEQVQRLYPGIKPASGARANQENDPYHHMETFKIRVSSSNLVATVHSRVVLNQSPWLRREVARQNGNGPEVEVRRYGQVAWWQVAWALEFMYTGTVPGFRILASEEVAARYPDRQPRSILWGLLELWDAAHFFGLEELEGRAEAAFRQYLSTGIRRSILLHRGALPPETVEGGAEPLTLPNFRLRYEFQQAAWRLFSSWFWPINTEYISTVTSIDGEPDVVPIAQDENALRAWKSAMFDKAGEPEGEDLAPEDWFHLGTGTYTIFTFRPIMMDVCMQFAQSGLFELSWFTGFVTAVYAPEGLRYALEERMMDTDSRWPRDEYPSAPYSFERVNPWRLIASNARAVPPRNAQ